jgi:hypothetical protein
MNGVHVGNNISFSILLANSWNVDSNCCRLRIKPAASLGLSGLLASPSKDVMANLNLPLFSNPPDPGIAKSQNILKNVRRRPIGFHNGAPQTTTTV